jgi:hypothetical protein
MKKYIIVLLLAVISKFNFSQNKFEYNHAYGASICFGIKNNYFNLNPQFQYNAEIDYLMSDDFSFSLSLYPTVGLLDAYFNDSHFAIPFGFQINLGNAASKYSLSNQGFFLHVGLCDIQALYRYFDFRAFFSLGFKVGKIALKFDFIPVKGTKHQSNLLNFGILKSIGEF